MTRLSFLKCHISAIFFRHVGMTFLYDDKKFFRAMLCQEIFCPPEKFCETSWHLGMAKTTFPGHHDTLKFSVSSSFYRSDSYRFWSFY